MQSKVNQEENLNRIITVPNLLSFSALSDSGNYMELLCKVKSGLSRIKMPALSEIYVSSAPPLSATTGK